MNWFYCCGILSKLSTTQTFYICTLSSFLSRTFNWNCFSVETLSCSLCICLMLFSFFFQITLVTYGLTFALPSSFILVCMLFITFLVVLLLVSEIVSKQHFLAYSAFAQTSFVSVVCFPNYTSIPFLKIFVIFLIHFLESQKIYIWCFLFVWNLLIILSLLWKVFYWTLTVVDRLHC